MNRIQLVQAAACIACFVPFTSFALDCNPIITDGVTITQPNVTRIGIASGSGNIATSSQHRLHSSLTTGFQQYGRMWYGGPYGQAIGGPAPLNGSGDITFSLQWVEANRGTTALTGVVSDSTGNTVLGCEPTSVTVQWLPQVFVSAPTTGYVGEPVNITGSQIIDNYASNPGALMITSFGDGGSFSGPGSTTHTYTNPGNYNISAAVNDGTYAASAQKTIQIVPHVYAVECTGTQCQPFTLQNTYVLNLVKNAANSNNAVVGSTIATHYVRPSSPQGACKEFWRDYKVLTKPATDASSFQMISDVCTD